jgi:hypothetical protein
MLADGDLNDLELPDADPPEPPAGRVIVVERAPDRWATAFLLPAAIVMVAVAVLAVRLRVQDWRGLVLATGPAPAPAGGVVPESPGPGTSDAEDAPPPREVEVEPVVPDDVVPVEPVDAVPVEQPAPPEEGVDSEEPGRTLEPKHLSALLYQPLLADREPAGEPAARVPVPIAEPEAEVEPGDAMAEIRRAAERKRIEQERLEAIKPMLLDRDLAEVEERRDLRVREHREDRLEFLDRVRSLLAEAGPDAAQKIRDLAHLPRELPPLDLGLAGERASQLAGSWELRRAWVANLRRQGLDEPAILRDLVQAQRLNRVARSGPKGPDEAVLRAAAELLAAPIEDATSPLVDRAVRPARPASPAVRGSQFGRSRRR